MGQTGCHVGKTLPFCAVSISQKSADLEKGCLENLKVVHLGELSVDGTITVHKTVSINPARAMCESENND
jgi:hypothetical protein